MTAGIVIEGSRWLTRGVIQQRVVVVEVRDTIAIVRDEDTGEVFHEVAAFAARTWAPRGAAAESAA